MSGGLHGRVPWRALPWVYNGFPMRRTDPMEERATVHAEFKHSGAELQEIMEGMVAVSQRTHSLAQELFEDLPRILWTDSQSALAIMPNEGGWRTRHAMHEDGPYQVTGAFATCRGEDGLGYRNQTTSPSKNGASQEGNGHAGED